MATIAVPLTGGKFALIDESDAASVAGMKWQAVKRHRTFYAYNYHRRLYMHRLIMRAEKGIQIDHRDHDGLNNTRQNLREATLSQNNRNARKKSGWRSRFKGVSPDRRGWKAQIRIAGKKTHLGSFSSEIEAAKAYDAAAVIHFGEFAFVNFPPTST